MENISKMISEGYKIMKFERDVDLISGEEFGKVELRALDGYIRTVNVDDNKVDEIEKMMFNYLKNEK